MIATITHELAASGGTALTAGSCAACLEMYGADPSTAVVISVVLGLVYRIAADWLERRRRRQAERSSS